MADLHFIPMSALKGDNVVEPSTHMPWYQGPPLLHHLETVHIASDRNLIDLRFPVQYVIRPNLDFRGFSGTVASGIIRKGDEVMVLPSGKRSRVKSIVTYDGERGRSVRAAGGDGHARRRDRRQPRRHARAPGQRAARRPPRSRRWSSGWPRSRSSPGKQYLVKQTTKRGQRHGEPPALPRRRQHAAPRGDAGAGDERSRPLHGHAEPAAGLRRLPPQPHDRRVHRRSTG